MSLQTGKQSPHSNECADHPCAPDGCVDATTPQSRQTYYSPGDVAQTPSMGKHTTKRATGAPQPVNQDGAPFID